MENKKYFSLWSSYKDMRESFSESEYNYETKQRTYKELPANFPTEDEILFACYEDHDYSGAAHVIYTRNGHLYECSAYHCSCNGLEGSWDSGEVTWESLALRLKDTTERDREYYPDGALEAFESLINLGLASEKA